MIHYNLKCRNFHQFDSWFVSSESFDELVERGLLDCPECGDSEITKDIMAPNVITVNTSDQGRIEFENVGPRFAKEVRAIHIGKKKERNLIGTVTTEESEKLKEEGIKFYRLSDDPDKEKNCE